MSSTRSRYRHVGGPPIHTHASRGPVSAGDDVELTPADAAPHVAAGVLILVDWLDDPVPAEADLQENPQ